MLLERVEVYLDTHPIETKTKHFNVLNEYLRGILIGLNSSLAIKMHCWQLNIIVITAIYVLFLEVIITKMKIEHFIFTSTTQEFFCNSRWIWAKPGSM